MHAQYNRNTLSQTQIVQFVNALNQGAFDIFFKHFEYSTSSFHDQFKNTVKLSFYEEVSLTHRCVVLSYPSTHYFSDVNPDAVIRKQMKAFKSSPTGSGMGFGHRDISFRVPNAQVASVKQNIKAFVNQNLKSPISLKVAVHPGT